MSKLRSVTPAAGAVVSGLCLTLLFAPFRFWLLGWVCLVPLLWALAGAKTALGATAMGFLFGLLHRLTTIYWVIHVMEVHGGLPAPAAWGVLLLLSTYLALYPATVGFLMHRPLRRFGPKALFLFPYLWVAAELVQTYVLTGFPWNLLGNSQIEFLPAIQCADITGVYGVSFLVAVVNCAIAFALLEEPGRKAGYWAPPAATAALLALALIYGGWRIAAQPADEATFDVALIQDDLSNDERLAAHSNWNSLGELFAYYVDNTRKAAAQGADLVLWAEGALLFLDMHPEEGEALGFEESYVFSLARDEGVWLLIGGNDYFMREGRRLLHNSAYTISPENSLRVSGKYDKVHLTPFGEYVPYTWLFGWLQRVVPEISDFEPGEELRPMPLMGGSVGVGICYEVIFPDLMRRFAARGAGLLATISNDAWFGRTPANDQHFDCAIMRAVENRRYLVRCAATGVSGIIAPDGRVTEVRTLDGGAMARTPIYERVVVRGSAAMREGTTFYAAWGDVFSYACLIITVITLVWMRYTGKE